MKKTVVLILIFLPIVLLLIIAFAGRILSTYQRIDVENVFFVNDDGENLDSSASITLGIGETKQTKIKIYPELATDKRVTYSSSDETVCTVGADGAVTGMAPGHSIIVVKTVDGNKTAMINVIVKSSGVTGVTLSPDTLTLMKGESADLEAIVSPYTALNKKVSYKSSDTSVATVSATGKVRAVGPGTATITVTTEDGGFTATCTVTVTDDTPPLYFDFTGISGITLNSTGTAYRVSQSTVDISAGLKVEDGIEQSDIRYRIKSGDATVDENGILTFTNPGAVVVEAYVGDKNNPTYRAEVRIGWSG